MSPKVFKERSRLRPRSYSLKQPCTVENKYSTNGGVSDEPGSRRKGNVLESLKFYPRIEPEENSVPAPNELDNEGRTHDRFLKRPLM